MARDFTDDELNWRPMDTQHYSERPLSRAAIHDPNMMRGLDDPQLYQNWQPATINKPREKEKKKKEGETGGRDTFLGIPSDKLGRVELLLFIIIVVLVINLIGQIFRSTQIICVTSILPGTTGTPLEKNTSQAK